MFLKIKLRAQINNSLTNFRQLTPLAPQRVRNRADQPPLLYATWAPNSDALIFVFHNDLYYATSPKLTTMYRITDTGQIGTVFNGVPDWVYEGN